MGHQQRDQARPPGGWTESDLDSRAQTFVICSIGLALVAGPVGYELGAYGTVFFQRVYSSWFVVTSALLSLAILPAERLPFPKYRLIFLLIPSVWMLVRLVVPVHGGDDAVFPVLFVLGMLSYLACMPYAVYLLLLLVKPEFFALPGRRPKFALFAIALLFLGTGYLFGGHHDRMLTCRDFELSGSFPPQNCTPVNPAQ